MDNEFNFTIGDGATIHTGSDMRPATIISIRSDGKKIIIQDDIATRLDNNGMSELQDYSYSRNEDGAMHVITKRKDGSYRISGSKQLVTLGCRRRYYDYSF